MKPRVELEQALDGADREARSGTVMIAAAITVPLLAPVGLFVIPLAIGGVIGLSRAVRGWRTQSAIRHQLQLQALPVVRLLGR